jgi:hypothetical protein
MFWPIPRSAAATYVLHWATLVSNSTFYGFLTDFGVQPGTVGQILVLSNQYAAPTRYGLDESSIEFGIFIALITANRVPKTGENFVVFLPQGVTSNTDTGGRFFGHHAWVNVLFPDGNVYPIVYSVVEYYSDWASTDYIMSHELLR